MFIQTTVLCPFGLDQLSPLIRLLRVEVVDVRDRFLKINIVKQKYSNLSPGEMVQVRVVPSGSAQ